MAGPPPTTERCDFCRIIAGEAAAATIVTGPRVWVFAARAPIRPGHLLVVPVRHVETFDAVPEPDYTEMMRVVRRMTRAARAAYQPVRAGLVAAGWDIPHAHLHIVPMHDYHDITARPLLEGHVTAATAVDLEDTVRRVTASLAGN